MEEGHTVHGAFLSGGNAPLFCVCPARLRLPATHGWYQPVESPLTSSCTHTHIMRRRKMHVRRIREVHTDANGEHISGRDGKLFDFNDVCDNFCKCWAIPHDRRLVTPARDIQQCTLLGPTWQCRRIIWRRRDNQALTSTTHAHSLAKKNENEHQSSPKKLDFLS